MTFGRSRWSLEARLLFDAAAAYRELPEDGAASLLKRPLLLALVLGAAVSALASGRFSARLIADGALSFAFVPAIEMAALGVVQARGTRRPMPFARACDLCFAGNAPWLLWLVAVAALFAILPPQQLGPWIWPVLFGCVVPLAWSIAIDFQFFKQAMRRSARGAAFDLLLFRAIAWTGALAYFFGIVAVSELPKLIGPVPP